MWYTAKRTATVETKQEKQLREARRTIKWIPFAAVLILVAVVMGVVKYVQHPDMEHRLDLIFPIGATLYIWSIWREARATLNGTPNSLYDIPSVLVLLLALSGNALSSLWHDKEMLLFHIVGTIVVAFTLFFLVIVVWGWASSWRAKKA